MVAVNVDVNHRWDSPTMGTGGNNGLILVTGAHRSDAGYSEKGSVKVWEATMHNFIMITSTTEACLGRYKKN